MINCHYLSRWLLIILLGLAIYAQTFGFSFVYDDACFIVKNTSIRSFEHVPELWKIFPQTRTIGFYTFAFNYWLNQLHPQGYHIFNVLVHLLAVGLVWACASVLFKIVGWIPFKDPVYQHLPFFIALLFLVHPGQTQAVSYISQRFESIATVFYLASVYTYLRARISTFKIHRILLFSSSLVFAILGLLTKEVTATIPLMILCAEFILFEKSPGTANKNFLGGRFWLIFVIGVFFVLLFMKMVNTNFIDTYFKFSAISNSHDGEMVTGGKYLLTQMRVFLTFLRLLIFPVHQNLDYDYPLSATLLNPPLTLVGLCIIVLMLYGVFQLRRQKPLIAFGFAWILVTFSINTAPRVNVIFEHKLYLISFGFLLAAVSAMSGVVKNRKILYGLLTGWIVILSVLSFERNHVWRDELTLENDILLKSPHKAKPYYLRGRVYYQHGDFTQAIADFNKALELAPDFLGAYIDRGIVYDAEGNFSQALSDYNMAVKKNPYQPEAYYNRGNIYNKQNNFIQALKDYNKAIELKPDYAESYANRGNVYVKQGDLPLGLMDFNLAIVINPLYADAYYNRGVVYDNIGNLRQALADYSKAIDIKSDYADAYNNRGNVYRRLNDLTRALADFNKAIEINSNNPGYFYNRSLVYAQLKSQFSSKMSK